MPADLGDLRYALVGDGSDGNLLAALDRHAQAIADPLSRIAEFFDRLADDQLSERLDAAQVIESRFARLIELLTLGAGDGAHHKDWVLDQIARELLGPAYDNWAAVEEHGWSNVTDNAIAP